MSKKEKQSSKKIDEAQKENEVKISHFQENIKANDELKNILKLALKQTNTTTREVLTKLAKSVRSYINEFKENLKDKTKTDDMMKLLSKKELTTHCYNLVGYNRKDEVNDLFEKVVSRSIRLALMLVDYPNEFNIDETTNEVFVMSKVLEPKIDIKIKGSKITKKVNNKDDSLIPVSTYVVDKMYQQKYPTGSRKPTNKDEKANEYFKNISSDFLKGLKSLISKATKKDVKFFDMIDEDTFEVHQEIKMLLSSEDYELVRAFSVEYQVDYNGKLEPANLDTKITVSK